MPTISLRLDDDIKRWLDTVVSQKNLNASALIREALEDKLREIDRRAKPRSNLSLSTKERLALSNQFKILAKLYPEDEEHYLKNTKIVEEGYELNFGWMTSYIYEGLSRDQRLEVLETLDLYSALNYSFGNLADKDGIQNSDISFDGFDGNHEAEYKGYAQFLVYEEGKFENLSNEARCILNSHFPILQLHRQRLQRWKKKGEPHKMNASTMRWIIDEPKLS